MDKLSNEVTLVILATLFLLTVAIGIVILVLIYQKRQLQYLKEKGEMQSSFQKEILRSQLEIQEQTLKYISLEIHDNIGQVLSLAKLILGTADSEDVFILRQKIEDSKKLVAKAIQDLRDLSKGLNTDYVSEMGLQKSIEYELEIIRKTGSFEISIETEGYSYKLEQQKELILFRIVQEVLSNIIRHAGAKSIHVRLRYLSGVLLLTIKDDGIGFKAETPENATRGQKGLGLQNIRNRAQLLGAQFVIESRPGEGTTVEIRLPNSN